MTPNPLPLQTARRLGLEYAGYGPGSGDSTRADEMARGRDAGTSWRPNRHGHEMATILYVESGAEAFGQVLLSPYIYIYIRIHIYTNIYLCK